MIWLLIPLLGSCLCKDMQAPKTLQISNLTGANATNPYWSLFVTEKAHSIFDQLSRSDQKNVIEVLNSDKDFNDKLTVLSSLSPSLRDELTAVLEPAKFNPAAMTANIHNMAHTLGQHAEHAWATAFNARTEPAADNKDLMALADAFNALSDREKQAMVNLFPRFFQNFEELIEEVEGKDTDTTGAGDRNPNIKSAFTPTPPTVTTRVMQADIGWQTSGGRVFPPSTPPPQAYPGTTTRPRFNSYPANSGGGQTNFGSSSPSAGPIAPYQGPFGNTGPFGGSQGPSSQGYSTYPNTGRGHGRNHGRYGYYSRDVERMLRAVERAQQRRRMYEFGGMGDVFAEDRLLLALFSQQQDFQPMPKMLHILFG